MDESYDVVVIGGAAAGLSAAVALARSRRSVRVIDIGDSRNASSGHVHNYLSRDGAPPAEIYAVGRAEVEQYGGTVEQARVTVVRGEGELFVVEVGERAIRARSVVVATGLRDELPDVPGLAARWGLDVLHCPYCHGWEVRDKRVGVLVTGPMAAFQALLFRQLTSRLTVFQHTGPTLSGEERERFDALGIAVVGGVVTRVDAGAAGMTGVQLADGSQVEMDALVVAPGVNARASMLAPLGLEPTEVRVGEHVIGTQIDADADGATLVPGVWVAGNVADLRATVVASAAAGLAVGGAVNAHLVQQDAVRAVAVHRAEHLHGEAAPAD